MIVKKLEPLIAVTALIAGALTLLNGAAPGAEPPAFDRSRFIGVDEIQAGMHGTGRTTFSGEGVSEFQVEVIGVLHRWIPSGDLIVVEASGGPLAETGIYQGMSGSPVYFEGRLAGAVSYNLGLFAERPIAGVTPIAEMLPLLDASPAEAETETAPSDDPRGGGQGKLEDGETKEMGAGETSVGEALRIAGQRWVPEDVQPIRTPLLLAGFAPETRTAMSSFLTSFGMEGRSGGASDKVVKTAATTGAGASALKPGDPVGVQLVRGDVEATALGTITHVDGDRVLAFGHPMFQAGAVDLPMTTAHVYTVYPSQAVSFVIGAAAVPAGRIITDQRTGIAGRLGESSPMVPVHIDIARQGGKRRGFDFEIIPNKFFFTQLLGFVAFNSFITEQKLFGDATLDVNMRVELGDGTRLDFADVLASTLPPTALAEKVSAPVGGILFNDLAPVRIASIHLELQVEPEIKTATIEEMVVDRYEVEPGQTIAATLYLKPFEADRRSIQIKVPVPADATPGPVLLRACDAESATRWEAERAPRRLVPATISQLVDLYEETSAHNVVRVTLHSDAHGVVVEGREMPGLPESVFQVMDSNRRTGGRSGSWGRLLHQERVKTEYQLSGCQELRLEVKPPETPAAVKGRSR